jgi:hypothetical protein
MSDDSRDGGHTFNGAASRLRSAVDTELRMSEADERRFAMALRAEALDRRALPGLLREAIQEMRRLRLVLEKNAESGLPR